ncbi:hypothetical protein [Metabacillus sediminilitoris]|uniref:hypothetical protein n=1 Tax=Metabacillus sediminilitoris TaxID=2567941 RepID=UPI001454E23F|nr:hypothetical protein [Metabacillus sediminilitoris]
MNLYQYRYEVKLLLINHTDEKEHIIYEFKHYPFQMPKIGPRPPVYCHPRYDQYYPVI